MDGDDQSYWAANEPGAGAWWQVDLEQPNTVSAVTTTFARPANYRYRLDGSLDGNTWFVLVDQSQNPSSAKVRTDRIPAGRHCQFVRLTFTALPSGEPAALAEMKVEGQHWP